MTRHARWIRMGLVDTAELAAAWEGMASVQGRAAAPIVLWAQARAWVCSGLVEADERQCLYVVIAPRRHAPGRPARWPAWALAAAVAAYRDLGLPAYLQDDQIWLHGCPIARPGATAIGECVVAGANLVWRFPSERFAGAIEAALRARLEAQYGWQFDTSWPSPAERAAIDEARAAQKAVA